MPATRGDRHWDPNWEYTLAHGALRERAGQLIGEAAVFARPEGLNAVWVGRVAPRKVGNATMFNNTDLAVYLHGSLSRPMTLAQVAIGAGEFLRTRMYRLDLEVLPEGLDIGTAILDERIQLALGGELVPDIAMAHQRYEALVHASEVLQQRKELPAGSEAQAPEP